MLADMLQLTLTNNLQDNDFELIFDSSTNQRRDFAISTLYPLGVPVEHTVEMEEKKTEELPKVAAVTKKESKLIDVYQSLKRIFESYPYAD